MQCCEMPELSIDTEYICCSSTKHSLDNSLSQDLWLPTQGPNVDWSYEVRARNGRWKVMQLQHERPVPPKHMVCMMHCQKTQHKCFMPRVSKLPPLTYPFQARHGSWLSLQVRSIKSQLHDSYPRHVRQSRLFRNLRHDCITFQTHVLPIKDHELFETDTMCYVAYPLISRHSTTVLSALSLNITPPDRPFASTGHGVEVCFKVLEHTAARHVGKKAFFRRPGIDKADIIFRASLLTQKTD